MAFHSSHRPTLRSRLAAALLALAVLGALTLPGAALGARPSAGAVVQLGGSRGCLVDRSVKKHGSCGTARALLGAGPFMGSRAIAISPDGRNVYVAAGESDAVAVFTRNRRSGALKQARGTAGCVASGGEAGCTPAIGLRGPNSVAVSPDGAEVYVTSRNAGSLTVFRRDPATGALTQLPGGDGCVSGAPIPGCATGQGLVGPDVVVVSPDGRNVYAGSFFGNAVAVFTRDAATGALTQPGGSAACIAEAIAGCAPGIALGAPEGMAVSADGTVVYVASALSNALAILGRDPTTGALAQATDGSGCIVATALNGCTPGEFLEGANAVALGGGNVYVTSLLSNSVTAFGPTAGGALAQKPGPSGCVVFLVAVGCSLGHGLAAPEGLDVSPDGASVYVTAYGSGALVALARRKDGGIRQVPGKAGCVAVSVPDCARGRALKGLSSVAVSPDGRFVYATAARSDAVAVFRRLGG
jgi:DNA-binding beta-propeller fold protein YncE